jgi:hypothetical protein
MRPPDDGSRSKLVLRHVRTERSRPKGLAIREPLNFTVPGH